MKNLALENYDIVEMDSNESTMITGGNPFWAGVAASAVAGFLYECINDWNNNVAAYHRGQR